MEIQGWVTVSAYAPADDREKEVEESFSTGLEMCLDGFIGKRIILTGDMNAKAGKGRLGGVLGA